MFVFCKGSDPVQTPWQCSWKPGEIRLQANAATGRPYQGGNQFFLELAAKNRGFTDTRWLTFNQAQKMGCQVKKGAKSETVIFYSKLAGGVRKMTDKEMARRSEEEKKAGVDTKEKATWVLRAFHVFNGQEIDGLPPLAQVVEPQHARIARCEGLAKASGADIREHLMGQGSAPGYAPGADTIYMPLLAQYKTPEDYYETLFHEMGHWTGHPSRMGRDLTSPFGTEGYAREELKAEIAAYMLAGQMGLGHVGSGRTASYVSGWVNRIKGSPRETEVLAAANEGSRISEYLLQYDPQRTQEMELEQGMMTPQEIPLEVAQAQVDLQAAVQGGGRPAEAIQAYQAAALGAMARAGATTPQIAEVNQAITRDREAEEKRQANLERLQELRSAVINAPPGREITVEERGMARFYRGVLESAHDRGFKLAEIAEVKALLADSMDAKDWGASKVAAFFWAKDQSRKEIEHRLQEDMDMAKKPDTRSPAPGQKAERLYLINVRLKDQAHLSRSGAVIDPHSRRWFVMSDTPGNFDRWLPKQQHVPAFRDIPAADRRYLFVPSADREELKRIHAAGGASAIYDPEKFQWYIAKSDDLAPFARWSVAPAQRDPKEAFAAFLKENGVEIEPSRIVADGKIHRATAAGGKPGNIDASYCLHLDGTRPVGLLKNYQLGDGGVKGMPRKWLGDGPGLAAGVQSQLVEAAKVSRQNREATQDREAKAARSKFAYFTQIMPPAREHPYFEKKGLAGKIEGLAGSDRTFFIDKYGGLMIAMRDIRDDKVVGMQRINDDGDKQYLSGSSKSGMAVAIGAEKPGQPFLVAEGVATAASIALATGCRVHAAMDAGNMADVAGALRERDPNRPLIFMADNDWARENEVNPTTGRVRGNPGLAAAKAAVERVGGIILAPKHGDAAKDWNDYLHSSQMPREMQMANGLFFVGHFNRALEQAAKDITKKKEEQGLTRDEVKQKVRMAVDREMGPEIPLEQRGDLRDDLARASVQNIQPGQKVSGLAAAKTAERAIEKTDDMEVEAEERRLNQGISR